MKITIFFGISQFPDTDIFTDPPTSKLALKHYQL
jgi:hypothetical protein